jgi:hypothetical protein
MKWMQIRCSPIYRPYYRQPSADLPAYPINFVLNYVIYSCLKQTELYSERTEDQFIELLKLLHLQWNPDIAPLFVVAVYGDIQVKGKNYISP